jgi:hypothetical protein
VNFCRFCITASHDGQSRGSQFGHHEKVRTWPSHENEGKLNATTASNDIQDIRDKKLKGDMRRNEQKARDAAYLAAQSEVLLTESAGCATPFHHD